MLDTIVAPNRATRSAPSTTVSDLAFRIHGGDHDGRLLRIQGAKSTIGSAPQCSVRLATAGVRPLHCLIFRNNSGTTVRRWSPDTELNGKFFNDAALEPGDRLRVGPIELEVITTSQFATNKREPAQPIPKQRKRVLTSRRRLKSLRSDLKQAKAAATRSQAEVERLAIELAETNRLRDTAHQALALLDEQQTSAADVQAKSDRQQLDQQLSAAITEGQVLAQSLELVQGTLAQRDDTLAQLQAEFQARLAAWHNERAELEASFVRDRAQHGEQQQAHESQSQLWLAEKRALLESLEQKSQLAQQLEAAVAELHLAITQHGDAALGQQQELVDQQTKLTNWSHELEQRQAVCIEVEQHATQLAQEFQAAQAETVALRDRVAHMEGLLSAAQSASVAEQDSQLAELCQQRDTAQQVGRILENEMQCLREQIAQADAELQQAHTSRQQAVEEYARLQAELDEQATQFATRNEQVLQLSQQIERFEAHARELQESLDCRSQQNAMLLQRLRNLERPEDAGAIYAVAEGNLQAGVEANQQSADLESQLRATTQQLALAQAQSVAAAEQLEQGEARWQKREQDLQRQVQCLENLARNLEENLRDSAGQDDPLAEAKSEQEALASQLTAANTALENVQRQWAEQRQQLEAQSLTANEQVFRLEEELAVANRLASEATAQLQGRDQLLSDLRDEVRAQMAQWQRDREVLQAELEQAQSLAGQQPETFGGASSLRNNDAIGHYESSSYQESSAVSSSEACAAPEMDNDGNYPSCPSDSTVNSIMARLGAAGMLRDSSHDEVKAREYDNDCEHSRSSCDDSAENNSYAAADVETSSRPVDEAPAVEEVPAWRVQALANCPEDEGSPAVPTTPSATLSNTTPCYTPAKPASNEPAADDEDSIEAYMARLMKRVRGEAVATAFVAEKTVVAPAATPQVAEPAVETSQEAGTYINEIIAPPAQFTPRISAPEQLDITTMRELAIQSARLAITQSNVRRRRQATLATIGIALGSVVGSGLLLNWGLQTGNRLAYVGAVVSFVGGLFWAVQRARRAPRGRAHAAPRS